MSHYRTNLYESQDTLKLDIKYTCLEIFSWESQVEFKINFASKWHYNAEGMSHSFEHNKLISISLTNLHWIFSVILVIIEILFFCKNLQCLACFPKLWSYQIMNIIITLSFKIWFGLHFKKTCHHKTTFESWEKMENLRWSVPLIPNKNSLNSTHTHTPPPSPILSEETLRQFGSRKRK